MSDEALQYMPAVHGTHAATEVAPAPALNVPLVHGCGEMLPAGQNAPGVHTSPITPQLGFVCPVGVAVYEPRVQ